MPSVGRMIRFTSRLSLLVLEFANDTQEEAVKIKKALAEWSLGVLFGLDIERNVAEEISFYYKNKNFF